MSRRISALLMAGVLLCGCTGCNGGEEPASGTNEPLTVNEVSVAEGLSPVGESTENRVFYEIFVGSFADSDGDGTGDLRGIIQRFDYLNDGDPCSGFSLGVEGIWLSPVFLSPSYHKYDVEDYYTIDPTFGTTEDLQELISLCHERDVKLILDLPINHTSDKNEWFVKFCEAHRADDTASPWYNWYSYGDSVSADGRVFGQISGAEEFYECNFSNDMPELDFGNPEVVGALTDVAAHYLDMGVDGFRFDAAKYIFFGEEQNNVQFWEQYLGSLREKYDGMFSVAEVWAHDSIIQPYLSATTCFSFGSSQLSGQIATTAKGGDVDSYTAYVEEYLRMTGENSTMAQFIANHDMDRAAGFLPVSGGEMAMAASLYLLSPGTPFIYYGEEIGMKGSRGSADTDANRRLAMLWGEGNTACDPVGATYSADKQINGSVAEQRLDENSLYSHYKRLLMVRRAYPEIADGTYTALEFPNAKAGGFISELNGSRVMVLHNTTKEAVTLDIATYAMKEVVFTTGAGAVLQNGRVTIEGQTTVILK